MNPCAIEEMKTKGSIPVLCRWYNQVNFGRKESKYLVAGLWFIYTLYQEDALGEKREGRWLGLNSSSTLQVDEWYFQEKEILFSEGLYQMTLAKGWLTVSNHRICKA